MTASTIVVVGGGFTGCITALRLVQAGHQVVLMETLPHLGGTLRDVQGHGGAAGRRFLRGCQYADVDAPWRVALDDLIAAHLDDVPHTMSSVTRQDATTRLTHDVALPALGGALPASAADSTGDTTARDTPERTLRERFETYGDWAPWLVAYAERTGHAADMLASRAALGLQLSRVVPAAVPAHEVLVRKAASPWADAAFALPRSARGEQVLRALVPRQGWSPFFDALHAHLEQQGVRVTTGVPLRVRAAPRTVHVEGTGLPPSAVYIWAGSPVPLHRAMRDAYPEEGFTRLDNAVMRAVHVHAAVAHWAGPLPHYVQWFDAHSPLFRLYVYRMGDAVQACFECRAPLTDEALRTMMRDAEQQCVSAGFGERAGRVRFEPLQITPQRLHHLQTAHDVVELTRLTRYLAGWEPAAPSMIRAVIDGAWLAYGREHKLHDIRQALDARNLPVAW